jgi:gas vesicle protein
MKFVKGLILGGLLATGAYVGLTQTKTGKQLSSDLQTAFKAITKELKSKLEDFEDLTKENFDEIVKAAVDQYSATKQLASDSKEILTEALEDTWGDMEKDLEKKTKSKK